MTENGVSESTLARVAKLINQAEHPNTSETEREAFLAMADRLMTRHAIDDAMVEAARAAASGFARPEPISRRIPFVDYHNIHRDKFRRMVSEICETSRVKGVFHNVHGEVTLIGFPADVAYAEMTWLSVHMQFVSKVDPKVDETKTYDANVYALKTAGVKWPEIARRLNKVVRDAEALGADAPWSETPWPDGHRLIRAYRRECERLGVEPQNHTQRHQAYRTSFVNAFTDAVVARLYRMRTVQTEDVRATTGAEVALRDRGTQIDEKLWEMFPELRPATAEEQAAWRAKWEQEEREEQARIAAMTPAQRRAYEREQAREERESARYWARADRERERLRDRDGEIAGRKAGEQVDLSGGKNRLDGASRPGIEG